MGNSQAAQPLAPLSNHAYEHDWMVFLEHGCTHFELFERVNVGPQPSNRVAKSDRTDRTTHEGACGLRNERSDVVHLCSLHLQASCLHQSHQPCQVGGEKHAHVRFDGQKGCPGHLERTQGNPLEIAECYKAPLSKRLFTFFLLGPLQLGGFITCGSCSSNGQHTNAGHTALCGRKLPNLLLLHELHL